MAKHKRKPAEDAQDDPAKKVFSVPVIRACTTSNANYFPHAKPPSLMLSGEEGFQLLRFPRRAPAHHAGTPTYRKHKYIPGRLWSTVVNVIIKISVP